MKKTLLFLFLINVFLPVVAADTLFLGPRNMRVSEDGEFSWIDVTPEPEAFDNLWAYRLFPAEKF
ncbi:MAG: hypothetical protein E7027_06510, partial [Elusimicrobium sp.]|nr:hypothetical protein [Elusimicrobium sp.]